MARMYDPNISRFLSEDTYTGDINDPLSLNLYTYCHNNPITYYDPTGHFIDIIADIGFIVWDVVDIVKDPTDWKNWAALGADAICAIVPVATGGGRAVKAADKAYDTVKKVSKTKKFLKSTKVVGKKVIKDAAIEGAIYSTANSVHQKATKGNVATKEVLNAGIEGAGRRAAGEVAGLGIGKGLERGANKIINSRAGKKAIKQVNDFVGEISQSKFATGLKNQYDNALYHAKNFMADESGHIKLPGGRDLKVRNVSVDDTVRSDNFININLQLFASKGKGEGDNFLPNGSRIKWGKEHGRNNVRHNNAIENELDWAESQGAISIRKNRIQRDVNGDTVSRRKPDASYVINGKRYNTNYVSNYELNNTRELNRELDAFNSMCEADTDAYTSLVFQYPEYVLKK